MAAALETILQVVCVELGVPEEKILGRTRRSHIANARAIFLWLASREGHRSGASTQYINKHHTLSCKSIKSVEAEIETGRRFRDKVERCVAALDICENATWYMPYSQMLDRVSGLILSTQQLMDTLHSELVELRKCRKTMIKQKEIDERIAKKELNQDKNK